MLILGLTGSIGMGKSTAANRFRALNIAVFDADRAVHDLYSGAAVPAIEEAFAGTTANGSVNRQKLHQALLADPTGLQRLEKIVHPMVREAKRSFLREQAQSGAGIAVLEVPLLFETGGQDRVDAVVVVSTDPQTQRARVLERPGMTDEKLTQILARQMPDEEKRARADFVVDTGGEISQSHAQIDSIVERLRDWPAKAYQRHWRDA